MSLPESSQESLFAARNEFPELLPEDNPMMIFSRLIYSPFKDHEFESCYSDDDRPAISPAFLACVTLLQFRGLIERDELTEAKAFLAGCADGEPEGWLLAILLRHIIRKNNRDALALLRK